MGLHLKGRFQLGQTTKDHSREVHLLWNSLTTPQEPNALRKPSPQWEAACGSALASLQFIAISPLGALESGSRYAHWGRWAELGSLTDGNNLRHWNDVWPSEGHSPQVAL